MLKTNRKFTLRDKFILNFLLIYILTTSLLSYVIFYYTGKAIIDRTQEQLTSSRVFKSRQIESFIEDRKKELMYLKNNFKDALNKTDKLKDFVKFNNYFSGFIILNNKAIIENYSKYDSFSINESDLTKLINNHSNDSIFLNDYILNNSTKKWELIISLNIKNSIICFRISTDKIDNIMLETNPKVGLGFSGETYLAGKDKLMRSTSRFFDNSIMSVKIETNSMEEALTKNEANIICLDYRGINVISSSAKLNINGLDWILFSEIDYSEAFEPVQNIRIKLIIITLLMTTIVFVIIIFISKKITNPLTQLTNASKSLQDGIFLSEEIPTTTNDEIGELTKSFNSLNKALKHKEQQLLQERIRRFSLQADSQEKEKERLSKELHDGIGQMIIALKLRIENIDINSSTIQNELEKIKSELDNLVNETRRIAKNLMPTMLYNFSINEAIVNMLNQYSALTKIDFSFDSEIEDIKNKKTKIYIYRILQEAVNNIIKHSQAKKAEIKITKTNGLTIIVSDDGIGFDYDLINKTTTNGLHNIQDRVKYLGGNINIETSHNKGCLIIINIKNYE